MEYPYKCKLQVKNVFGEKEVEITINSSLTIFVGENASGKTQTLKAIRDYFKKQSNYKGKVRYLSSNRIGTMESYRSKTYRGITHLEDFSVGSQYEQEIRHEIETSSGDFFTMDDRRDIYIKVAERLSVLFNRQIYIRWDAGKMKVFFEKTEDEEEYSVAAEASGLINIISILAALFDDEIEVLLIDEPEVSLHPQFQAYLLNEMKKAVLKYKKTIIISTHSTEMLSINSVKDLSDLVFFSEKKMPLQIKPDAPELKSKKLVDFLMRMSQIYKAGFFAKKILLIEGASDLIICRFLSNRLNLNIDAAGSQIIPVDGKGQFSIITKFFRLIGKEVAILTDLDGFVDDNDVVKLFVNLPKASEKANECGMDNLSEIIKGIRTTLSDLVQNQQTNLRDFYEDHPYWINKSSEDDDNKIIKRALVAQLFNSDDESIENLQLGLQLASLKKRLNRLFSILESVGCFVLKKGAIESYYLHEPNTTYAEKPSVAVEEISKLQYENNETISNKYEDVINSLKYIAITKMVDESLAIKKELLSELPLIIGIINSDSNEREINSIIKQAKGSSSSLFSYEIINNDNKVGVKVSLKSKIIDVDGLPFEIFKGENVNIFLDEHIKPIKK